MSIFNFFSKKKKTLSKKIEENMNYSNIIEITKILTKNDIHLVNDMTLLANNREEFLKKYKS